MGDTKGAQNAFDVLMRSNSTKRGTNKAKPVVGKHNTLLRVRKAQSAPVVQPDSKRQCTSGLTGGDSTQGPEHLPLSPCTSLPAPATASDSGCQQGCAPWLSAHSGGPVAVARSLVSQDSTCSKASHAQAKQAFQRAFSGSLSITRQCFDYLVVYDLEATCNKIRDLAPVEIIELSCVIIDTKTQQLKAQYQGYVRPTEHPVLDPFCIELTGIQQHQVDAAKILAAVLEEHHGWLQQQGLLDNNVTFAPVTWTDWDLKVWHVQTAAPDSAGASAQVPS